MNTREINPNTLPKMDVGTLNAPSINADDAKRASLLARLAPTAQVAHADKPIEWLRSYAKTMRLDPVGRLQPARTSLDRKQRRRALRAPQGDTVMQTYRHHMTEKRIREIVREEIACALSDGTDLDVALVRLLARQNDDAGERAEECPR